MRKWSVIIPTLWRSDRISKLINDLDATSRINEIILIDNAPEQAPKTISSPKLKIISKGENIFVNPAWNWGIQEAVNEYVVLCNDDIAFDMKIFEELEGAGLSDAAIGCHYENFIMEQKPHGQMFLHDGHCIGKGWGCLIFIKKSNYIPIPSELKIWCGDDWIVHTHNRIYSVMWPIQTEMSTSSSLPTLNALAQKDKEIFKKSITKRMARRITLLSTEQYGKFNRMIELHYLIKRLGFAFIRRISIVWKRN